MLQPAFGPYTFPAAHVELHDGELRPMDGHTYRVTVRLQVCPAIWRSEDGAIVQMTVNKLIAPLRHRTLVAAQPAAGRCLAGDREVTVEAGQYRYVLPRDHVRLLPIGNTTVDALAGYLLDELTRELVEVAGVTRNELTLAESPVTAVTVSAGIQRPAFDGGSRP
jgi:hypothetical protein